jgi:hypothetical protein
MIYANRFMQIALWGILVIVGIYELIVYINQYRKDKRATNLVRVIASCIMIPSAIIVLILIIMDK